MIQVGVAPFYEVSSRGDRRFSAFYARTKKHGERSIEEVYQASKKFLVEGKTVTGLSWREAKGRRAINQAEASDLYAKLWRQYIKENPALLDVLKSKSGLQDIFGEPGHVCQASELWEIRNHG